MSDDLPRITRWRLVASRKGLAHGIPREIVLAIIAQESSGNPFAIRPEPGFWRRYLPGLRQLVDRTASKRDDHWYKYPDVFACSYGLMQVMYPVALERGLELHYPTELCDADTGVDAGCRQLSYLEGRILARDGRTHLAVWQDAEATKTALLLYNGGGDPRYPERILTWRDRLTGTSSVAV